MLLTERVHWIVALLFPEGDWYGLGNGLVAAPAFERFIEEEASLQGAPHLVAYWLFHHLVFGNQEATKRLAAFGRESAYPAARELAFVRHREELEEHRSDHDTDQRIAQVFQAFVVGRRPIRAFVRERP